MLLAVIVLSACAKKTEENQDTDADSTALSESVNVENDANCFAYQAKGDSAFMKMTITDGVVAGDLSYALAEKDKNKGTIDGKLIGDTLLVNYKFMSEGVESTREAAFLKKGNDWVEGFGPVEEKQGAMHFKDRSKLNFDNGLTFKAVDCN